VFVVEGIYAGSQIKIYNAAGQIVARKDVLVADAVEITIAHVESGVYFMEITHESGVVQKKLTKL
jgi:hypothetical protein